MNRERPRRVGIVPLAPPILRIHIFCGHTNLHKRQTAKPEMRYADLSDRITQPVRQGFGKGFSALQSWKKGELEGRSPLKYPSHIVKCHRTLSNDGKERMGRNK